MSAVSGGSGGPGLLEVAWWRIQRELSSVRVSPTGVRVRNFPERGRSFALDEVDRVEWVDHEYRRVATLLLTGGAAVAVHAVDERRPGAVTDLNDQVLRAREAGS